MMSRNENSANITSTTSTTAPPPTSSLQPPVVSDHQMLSTTAAIKLCHIVKRADFEGYGFNLHSEKSNPGQYIGKVDSKSPAELAGLKEGDRIIEVNGVTIGSETHKQVVMRIKAIACEVRLLLIDVDGKGGGGNNVLPTAAAVYNESKSSGSNNIKGVETTTATAEAETAINGNMEAYQGTVQEIPGASANISSISMISTKRTSSSSSSGNSQSISSNNGNTLSNSSNRQINDMASPAAEERVVAAVSGADVTDKVVANPAAATNENRNNYIAEQQETSKNCKDTSAVVGVTNNNYNNNIMSSIPLPPSASVAKVPPQQQQQAFAHSSAANGDSSSTGTRSPVNKAGSLQLPMTAAEMRAKLLAKKKFDPKNESVDLKKKFEIIQKL